MPRGLTCIYNIDIDEQKRSKDSLVDIVAVQDLGADSDHGTWTDPETGINWLRDLLPKYISVARILTYGYSLTATSLFEGSPSAVIAGLAESLVQELYADRKFEGMRKRPIIFICHGMGGVLVKRSLIYSSTRTAAKVEHLWDQYISTFAILFFGTPHGRTTKANWLALERYLGSVQAVEVNDLEEPQRADEDLNFCQSISTDFSPCHKQFHMFFFWEALPTSFLGHSDYIVDYPSAVLNLDNTEKAGIHATHAAMVKFASAASPGFRIAVEALSRYCDEAPRIIAHRWKQAIPALNQLRAGEAFELGGPGFDVHLQLPFWDREIPVERKSHHFYLPEEAKPDFVGREDMFRVLRDAFFPAETLNSGPGRKSFIVFGMGGTGKTQFCSKFAQNHRDHYGSVFTIRAASAETIKESFCDIGKLGGLEATENAGRHFLSELREPWLLIIDNADDPSLDLAGLFPRGDAAHILVTTRNPDFRQLGSLGSLDLKGLKEEEALQLLLTRAGIPAPWDTSSRKEGNLITKTLGYLALALVHAGNCIFRRICSLGEYLNLHFTSRNIISERRASTGSWDDEDEMVRKVYTTFDLSFELLSRRQTVRGQDASDLLSIVSFYHFERIPIEIFTRAIRNRRSAQTASPGSFVSKLLKGLARRFEPPKVLPPFLKDEQNYLDKYRITRAVSELQSFSLVNYDDESYSFSLHPLVHAWARDRLSNSEKKIWASMAFNTLMESISLPPESSSEADGDFHRDVLPHLNIWLSEQTTPLSQTVGFLTGLRVQAAKIIQQTFLLVVRDQVLCSAKCGYVLAERGQFDRAAIHLQEVNDALTRVLGIKNERTMTAMLGLAGVFWGLGRLEEAIALQAAVVDTRSTICGPNHEQTLQAMDQLGKSYWLHGQYKEALELQTICTERMKASLGPDHPQTLAALDNLGVTLGSWHRYEESMNVHQQVLLARKKSLGETHLDTITTMSNLAMALSDLKQLDKARSIMQTVHEQRRQQLGREHPWTLWALAYLAKVNMESGLLDEAEEMLSWGVEAGERSLSKDHLGVLMGLGILANVYSRQWKLEEAEALSKDTLISLERSRGTYHPDVVFCLFKRAQLFERMKEKEKAIDACRLALGKVDMRLTREHPLAKQLESLMNKLQTASSEDSHQAIVERSQSGSQVTSRFAIRVGKTW